MRAVTALAFLRNAIHRCSPALPPHGARAVRQPGRRQSRTRKRIGVSALFWLAGRRPFDSSVTIADAEVVASMREDARHLGRTAPVDLRFR